MPSQANQCQSSPSQTITNLTYAYAQSGGNDGEITTITDGVDAGRNATYAYDALGRVSTATTQGSTNYPKWGLSWTYDHFGNRTTQSISAGCVAPMTCPTNSVAVSTATNRITTSGYGYDTNGNMTNDGMNSIVPDAQNRVQSTSGSLGSGTYTYGASGHRVVKSSGGNTTVYIYAGNQVIAEYLNGTLTKEYVHAGGNLLATHDSGTLYFHHRDHQSIRVTTDASGNKMGEQGHYPFGESWYLSNTTTKWQHTTYERDPESGNDYAMHRHNVNRLGRFLSLDPVRGRIGNPQRLNRYSYVENDPINRRDPTGLDGTWTGYDDMGSSNSEGSLDNSFCGVCMMAGPGEVVMDGTIVSASLGNMALATGAGAWGPAPSAPSAANSSTSEGADPALDLGTFALTNLDPGSTGSSNAGSGASGSSGSCAYLNDGGNGVESIDNQSSATECQGTQGAFIPSQSYGQIQSISVDQNSDNVLVQGVGAYGGLQITIGTPGGTSTTTGNLPDIYDTIAGGEWNRVYQPYNQCVIGWAAAGAAGNMGQSTIFGGSRWTAGWQGAVFGAITGAVVCAMQ